MATRQQQWATSAHQEVVKWKEKNSAERAKYKTWCRRASSLIQQSGLVQALVFMRAKSDDGAGIVGNAFARTLLGPRGTLETLVEQAKSDDTSKYMALTQQLMEIAVWYRRFAEIEISETEND